MARTTLTMPFGGGLDRLSGAAAVDPSRSVDLRNVYLGPARMELRRGLANGLGIGWGTDVIGICAARKTGLLAVVVYDSVTRGVRLYTSDGATASLVGALWTINAAVSSHLPRVLMADVYDQIFIAHDEQNFTYRNTTKAYDVTASTAADFSLNLDRSTTQAVKFRGVARHLSYLIGWGYGTATEPNRPETLRISMPGDPLNFIPEHYFLVGARSDPVIGGRTLTADGVGAQFIIGKQDEAWKLVGFDRQSFGVVPLDGEYGFRTSRAHVAVNGELFAWTLQGPRSTTGGPFGDLALPLDLNGALPDPAAAPSDDGFAWYDPNEQEVVFCFGTFAYVLHLRQPPRRWSYRTFGRSLASAGVLQTASGTGTLSLISATIGSITPHEPAYTPDDEDPSFTVPWTLSGAGTGTETVEVWGRAEIFGRPGHLVISSWKKLGSAAATALTLDVSVPYFMTSFDLAVRVVNAGTPGSGFTNTPDNWPASARATAVSAGAVDTFDIMGLWERRSATLHGQPFNYIGPGSTRASNPELTFTYEQSTNGGGSWQRHAAGNYYGAPLTGSVHANIDAHLAPDDSSASTSAIDVQYRLTVTGPSASDGPTTATSVARLAPAEPTISAIAADNGDLNFSRHLHVVTTVPGAHGGTIEVRARHDPDGTWTATYTASSLGTVEAVPVLDNTGGADDVRAQARTRLQTFGVDDFSSTAETTASF